MLIRIATEGDIPEMGRVRMSVRENRIDSLRSLRPGDTERMIGGDGRGWVAEVEGRIVGFAIADLSRANVYALFIEPGYERRGIGRALHDAMMDWLFSTTVSTVWLSTDPGTCAETFYRQAGWISTGIVEKGESRFEMSRDRWAVIRPATSSDEEISIRLLKGELHEMTELQHVLEGAPRYSHRITGLPPGPADAQSTYSALPPDTTYDAKFVFGIWRPGAMIGVIDLVRGYPLEDTAFLGLLLLSEKHQRRGYGRAAYQLVEEVIRGWRSCRRVRLAVVRVNAEVIPFWLGLGFQATGEVKPYRYASIISENLLFEKAL